MRAYHDIEQEDVAQGMARYHPWTTTMDPSRAGSYVDFKNEPERIATSLEDLQIHNGTTFATEVEQFLRWANVGQTVYETNDFATQPVGANESSQANGKPLQLLGRVSILFRDLKLNCTPEMINRFTNLILAELEFNDRDFDDAVWSVARWPHRFTALKGSEADDGFTFLFHFWAWGETRQETEANAAHAFLVLRRALEGAARRLQLAD